MVMVRISTLLVCLNMMAPIFKAVKPELMKALGILICHLSLSNGFSVSFPFLLTNAKKRSTFSDAPFFEILVAY